MATTKELLRELLASLTPADKAELLRQAAEPEPVAAKTPVQALLEDLADHRVHPVNLGVVLGRLFAKLDFTGEPEEPAEDTEPDAPAEPAQPVDTAAAEPPVTVE